MEPQRTYRLIMQLGPTPGKELDLNSDTIVIGREAGVDIQIQALAVSRRHVRLVRRPEGYWIEDLGSSNGTFINGVRLEDRVPLNPGDRIGLGQAVLLVYDGPPVRPSEAPGLPGSFPQEPAVPPTAVAPKPGGTPYQPPPPPTPQSPPPAAPQTPGPAPVQTPPPGMPGTGGLAATMLGQEIDLGDESDPPRLVITIAGEASQTYTLDRDRYSLGRAADNDIVIQSKITSRKHALLQRAGQGYQWMTQPEATNPVYHEGRPLSGPRLLRHGDTLRIGGQDPGLMVSLQYLAPGQEQDQGEHTIEFGEGNTIQIGRDPSNDVVVPVPNVSRFHAQIERVGQRYRIRDLRSSNGTFVNDQRVEGETWLQPDDAIRIGPYRFVMGQDQISQFEETGGLRVESIGLNKWVRKDLNILQDISLTFKPREFIVVVGQSGGGKSTLVDAIAGYRPATHGKVYVNDIDVYRNFDAVRNEIGFVPQRDIIHMELTVYQALDFAARLRMPPDTSKAERHQRVMEVLEDLDLLHRKDVQISGLSGGQQKRVSIGVELLTKPGLFFLDEPTSGLDPGTETALMQLMRRLADQGRTIVLITHATKNVMLADKVVFLARGGYLAWFGPPNEALEYFDQFRSERERRTEHMDFDKIYAILDDPSRGSPENWAENFKAHPAYYRYVVEPLQQKGYTVGAAAPAAPQAPRQAGTPAKRPRPRQVSGLRQFFILSARNLKILTRDRFSLALMLAAAPLIALLDFVLAAAMGANLFDYVDGDFPGLTVSLFLLTVYGVMVGGLSQMREIVKEQDIYKRERLVNLKVFPYVMSKVWIAFLLALYQTAAYVIIRYLAFDMPGGVLEFVLIYISLALATIAGMMLGLFASVMAPNANSAPLIVILLILPQIVLGGALIPLPSSISMFTSTRWAFESFMATTGPGSDVAADICWSLPGETRKLMTTQDKLDYGCRCMGPKIFDPESCNYPGVGAFYNPAVDAPPPVEPPPLGDAPPEPEIPDPPPEPQDQSDQVAMAQYFDDLQAYQEQVDQIQADYKVQVDAYQARANIYQSEVIAYQQALAEWQINRNAAIGAAEIVIDPFQRDFGWAFVDKEDADAFWSKITRTWLSQGAIILVLLVAILILIRRKDKVQ